MRWLDGITDSMVMSLSKLPLQCSCLENPRDGRALWAAICGVAQSRTRLKRLNTSSQDIVKDREVWCAAVHRVAMIWIQLTHRTTTTLY